MQKTISISSNYGFEHNWTLHAFGRSFYLGQDVKFCQRVLGMEPSYVVQQIGSNDLRNEETKQRLAEFICDELNLNEESVNEVEDWGLCCQ